MQRQKNYGRFGMVLGLFILILLYGYFFTQEGIRLDGWFLSYQGPSADSSRETYAARNAHIVLQRLSGKDVLVEVRMKKEKWEFLLEELTPQEGVRVYDAGNRLIYPSQEEEEDSEGDSILGVMGETTLQPPSTMEQRMPSPTYLIALSKNPPRVRRGDVRFLGAGLGFFSIAVGGHLLVRQGKKQGLFKVKENEGFFGEKGLLFLTTLSFGLLLFLLALL